MKKTKSKYHRSVCLRGFSLLRMSFLWKRHGCVSGSPDTPSVLFEESDWLTLSSHLLLPKELLSQRKPGENLVKPSTLEAR